MTDIIAFVPSANHDAKTNLLDFIELCKKHLKPLNRNIAFEQDIWETSGLDGKSQQYNSHLCFTRLGVRVHGQQKKPPIVHAETLLRNPFKPFAKAMIIYMHGMKPTKNIRIRYEALRYLEEALNKITGSTCPTATTPQVLQHACSLMIDTTCLSTAYNCSKQLELIFKFMGNLGLLTVPTIWNQTISPPQIRRNRVGKEFDSERSKKLPSPAALEALAEIFVSTSDNSREIAISSICALMLCAPDRISEVLNLPLNCITPNWKDPESRESGSGLRWFPLKGASPMVKTVIPSMIDIANLAVQKLSNLSEPARVLARWYEANPDKLFLPAHLEHLRSKKMLSMNDLDQVLYGGNFTRKRAREWAKNNKIPLHKVNNSRSFHVTFQDLEKAIITMLPRGFPIRDPSTGMKYSEALCIVRPGEFDSRKQALQCGIITINYPIVRNALKGSKVQKSIFDERRLTEADGSPLFITTHMFRHYLNTLFRQGGKLSEEDIAKWSGRKDVRQNKVYNHVSDKDMLAHIRKAVGNPGLGVGPLVNIDKRIFITRDKFAELKIVTAHTNGLGYCTHDFTMLPCQIHGDCINCAEQVCVKGDVAAETNLRQMQKETYELLEKAKAAMDEGEYGANEWVKHQTLTLERLDQLITILDNPNVPVGSVIQLTGVVAASRLAQAVEQRKALEGSKFINQTIHSMSDVHALLTDGAT